MEKLISKYIFPLAVFLISLTLIILSIFFTKIEKEKKILAEKLFKEEQILKAKIEAEEKLYLMGKFDPSTREDFAPVPEAYNVGGYKMYLRKETLDAFSKMRESAKKDGINLSIASATRNFEYQKNLWNNKWSGYTLVEGKNLSKSIPDGLERFKKILEYSATPSTSRHHWGTDLDINNANPAYFKGKEGKKVYEWLTQNAFSFGFCQPYNLKNNIRPSGYNEEKWHWSYLPLSKDFTQKYKNLIKEEDINGFQGDIQALKLNLINDYVLGINPECI